MKEEEIPYKMTNVPKLQIYKITEYCHIIIQFIIPIWTLTLDGNPLISNCLEMMVPERL